MRLLSQKVGANGTPNFVKVFFEGMDGDFPFARPRPDEEVKVSVGGGYVHVLGDEADLYAPQEFSFSCLIDDTTNRAKLRSALSNPGLGSPWIVGSDVWVTTKGKGSIVQPDGRFVTTGQFADTQKYAADVEVLWTAPNAISSFGMRFEECYFNPSNISIRESADSVELSVTGEVYGDIDLITDFTSPVRES